ncbi:MAG TPA: hypothetical protein PLA94_12010 [Myxococcota bacterium]|nr:hypothetical protein [Myxococcota bacterium]HND30721.1 hypothetical protein [Myxococcota bacterium]
MLVLWLVACSLGLQAVEGDVVEGGTSNTEDYPPIEEDLSGHVYIVQQDDFRITEPPDLIDYQNQLFNRPMLFYVNDQAKDRLQLSMTLAAGDGNQDRCQPVRSLPTSDFSQNPTFSLGPEELRTSLGDQGMTLFKFMMEATFAEEGSNIRLGTITAVLRAEDLVPVIPEADCRFIEDLGGECHGCPGGTEGCFDLELSALRGRWQAQASFDPRETGDCQ